MVPLDTKNGDAVSLCPRTITELLGALVPHAKSVRRRAVGPMRGAFDHVLHWPSRTDVRGELPLAEPLHGIPKSLQAKGHRMPARLATVVMKLDNQNRMEPFKRF
jgi:hypothetical protein